MNQPNYKKILNVVAQQTRVAAYELARLKMQQKILEAELNSIQQLIAEYNHHNLKTSTMLSVDQILASHREIERLKQLHQAIGNRHRQNEIEQAKYEAEYKYRTAKEAALEKLIARQTAKRTFIAHKEEIVELAEYAARQSRDQTETQDI